jgi:hypothetical protein
MRSLHISTRRALQGLVATGSAVLLTAGVTSGAVQARGTAARTVTAQGPVAAATWEPCPFPGSPAELECATVVVPVDYADPDGAMTSVTVDRLPARRPAERVANLYFNRVRLPGREVRRRLGGWRGRSGFGARGAVLG